MRSLFAVFFATFVALVLVTSSHAEIGLKFQPTAKVYAFAAAGSSIGAEKGSLSSHGAATDSAGD